MFFFSVSSFSGLGVMLHIHFESDDVIPACSNWFSSNKRVDFYQGLLMKVILQLSNYLINYLSS